MKFLKYIGILLLIFSQACGQQNNQQNQVEQNMERENTNDGFINPEINILESRISLPKGFQRVTVSQNSFSAYLRQLPLKADGSEVLLYDGKTKKNNNIYVAVIDLDIGKKDLHQCADAVIRLRAEYLYSQQQYDKIHFNFTNGFRVDYSEWMNGKRIVVKGNETYWKQSAGASNSYENFWQYMEIIFTYAGTLSLTRELKPVDIDNLNIGDVFIQGGSPGHAVIVVDKAIDLSTEEEIFLLAQSYMPAQEIQILENQNNSALSPWYSTRFGNKLQTPEWTFNITDLKRFED